MTTVEFVLYVVALVASLWLIFVGIPWIVGRIKARAARRFEQRWVREALADDDSGFARDAANLRGDWQRATDRLAAEAAHPHRPMPGHDPEEEAR